MARIYLHGNLKKYGEYFESYAPTVRQAVRLYASQTPGLSEDIKSSNWHVVIDDVGLSEETLDFALGDRDVHILPVTAGSGRTFSIVAGLTLIAAGVYFTVTGNHVLGYSLISTGVGMTLGGLMYQKLPMSDYANRSEKKPSFLFNGPTNSTTQGLPVPVVYGKIMAGSVVVSASLSTVDYGVV